MPAKESLRSAHFPAIVKKHGKSMSFWFSVMKKIESEKYPQQVAYLKKKYAFSQTHANALVMYARGSKSAKRFATPTEYYKSLQPIQAKKVKQILNVIRKKYPKLDFVIAWNQPMLKHDNKYIFGVSTAKNHILIAPFNAKVFKQVSQDFADYRVNKKTIALPNDWKVDSKLLHKIIALAIKEVK
jgi:uncharacterized protein YdhG (YjbR/CyaY superfamily)